VSDVSSPAAGYSGTSLARKLGIAAGSRVLLSDAPETLALDVPGGVQLDRTPGSAPHDPYDVVLAFCPDVATLVAGWDGWHGRTTRAGALWIGWYKRAAMIRTDLNENLVREFGLGHGRVDVKICAIDAQWSGLKFVIRLTDR
jgi:hypothetical protein